MKENEAKAVSEGDIRAHAILAISQIAAQVNGSVASASGATDQNTGDPLAFKTYLDDDLRLAYNTGQFQQIVMLQQVHRDLQRISEGQELLRETLQSMFEPLSDQPGTAPAPATVEPIVRVPS